MKGFAVKCRFGGSRSRSTSDVRGRFWKGFGVLGFCVRGV